MASENVYPKIVSEQETKEYINKMFDKNVNESRIKEMMTQKLSLEKDLHRYEKVLRRWNKLDSVLGAGATISMCSEVLSVGMGLAAVAPFIVAPIIGGGFLCSGLIYGLTRKKKEYFLKKRNITLGYINKLYVYLEKAREDQLITIEELSGFRKIMEDYQKEIQGLQPSELDLEKLKKSVQKEAKKEFQMEMKESLKQELLSNFHLKQEQK